MIYLLIFIASLFLLGCITFTYRTYLNEIEEKLKERDDRILILEKRIEEYRRNRNDEMSHIYDNLVINNQDIKRITKEINKLKNKRENEKK